MNQFEKIIVELRRWHFELQYLSRLMEYWIERGNIPVYYRKVFMQRTYASNALVLFGHCQDLIELLSIFAQEKLEKLSRLPKEEGGEDHIADVHEAMIEEPTSTLLKFVADRLEVLKTEIFDLRLEGYTSDKDAIRWADSLTDMITMAVGDVERCIATLEK